MLITLSTTYYPATDLSYLLHKHPDRCQSFALSFGPATVLYSEATVNRCTVVLVLDIDPVNLSRGKPGTERPLADYVNDRPYVASSFLSVAIAKVFNTALSGNCKDRPELVKTPIPLEVNLPVLPCRGGEWILRSLFEPLGYQVTAEPLLLDPMVMEWGDSKYFSVGLKNTLCLSDLLSHLYVLIPVLDDDKHYWVGEEEIEKLLRHGEGWLATHPTRDMIANRYLKRQRRLTRLALERLSEEDDSDPETTAIEQAQEEEHLEDRITLNQERLDTVIKILKEKGSKRVIDLGCGEGKLLRLLTRDSFFQAITGVDVSYRALEIAQDRLSRGSYPQSRVQIFQGSLTYRDERLQGYEAATLVEVIEHLDLHRLQALERSVFDFAHPQVVILTTPNREYNILWESLPIGQLRHRDHRFEWTRAEFQSWAEDVATRFGYRVEFYPIGSLDPELGSPTQLGVFEQV